VAESRFLPATADLPPHDWVGPIQVEQTESDSAGTVHARRWVSMIHGATYTHGLDLRLDPHRPEVIALLARWLTVGERCPGCAPPLTPSATGPCHYPPCTGHRRRPHDIRYLLPRSLGGVLDDKLAGEGLAVSVERVRAGFSVVRGVLAPWRNMPGDTLWTWTRKNTTSSIPLDFTAVVGSDGWHVSSIRGPETGDEGRDCADRAALAAGFAYLNGATVTWPEIKGETT